MKYASLIPVMVFTIVSGTAQGQRPRVAAKAYVVASLDGSRVFMARNAHRVRSIASLSKLVAAMVVLDRGLPLEGRTRMIPLDWKVAEGGCRTRLRVGRSYRNIDLLYAAILSSDNRAVPALGRAVGLSPRALTRAMNRKVRALGLRKTHFAEPTGISHDNVSTAWEMVTILRSASRYRVLRKVMSTPVRTITELGTGRKIAYYNTNVLSRTSGWRIFATKTGFNDAAGYSVAFAYRDRKLGPVAVVVLGSSSKWQRFRDARLLVRSAAGRRAKPSGRRRFHRRYASR